MNTHKFFLGFLLCFVPFTVSGQRYISGCITDAETSEPIPGVSVFIANTTIGVSTDLEGNYRLKIPGEGSYRLTVSHVGYQSVFRDIEPGNISMTIDVSMTTNEIEEVTVTAKVKFRQKDINLFWETMLGKRPSRNTIYAVNPEDVYYYYNSDTRILKVTCRVPLHIINNETGYHIELVLEHFTHNYDSNTSTWIWEHKFSELEPENHKQKIIWEQNRKKVYQVSLAKFIKALYHNTLMEDGYLLTYQEIKHIPEYLPQEIYQNPDILTTVQRDGSKTLYVSSVLKGLMLVCFGKPINKKILDEVEQAQSNRLSWSKVGLFRHMLQTTTEPVKIFPDGTWSNSLHLSPCFSSNSLMRLNMILPVDYIPDDDTEVPDTDVSIENVLAERFQQQLSIFPQEKIYLHTDKPYYISGERIWFRAYLAGAVNHIPATVSRYVYVELINPLDTVVTRVKIRQDEGGAYHGYLLIPDDVPEGDYTVRAYTTFMRSQDEHYFFTKNIRIGDPQARAVHTETQFFFESERRVHATFRFSNTSTSAPLVPQTVKLSVNGGKMMNIKVEDDGTASINFDLPASSLKRTIFLEAVADKTPYRQFIRVPAPDSDFVVSFYPEGGSMMQGDTCQIAFKAMKSNGQSVHITGVVYDRLGNEIKEIKSEHMGMGSFSVFVEKGKTYYAYCKNDRGQTKRFVLPVSIDRGYALSVSQDKENIFVTVKRPEKTAQSDKLYLLAHTRGMVHFVNLWDHEKNIVYRNDQFPSGVLHFILFDAGKHPVSERLVFINNEGQAKVTYQPDKESYVPRSLVRNWVTLTDCDGEPLSGNFSVAVTSDREVISDSTSNILTQLLLTSDLRGNIENPAYYFQNTPESVWALDLLMLTQGWRRYNIAELAQGRFSWPESPIETGAEISGTVESILTGKPAENIEVTVASVKGGYFDNTKTDRDGRFYFRGGELPDSTRFVLHAVPQRRLRSMNLIPDRETFPEKTLSAAPYSVVIDRMRFAQYANKAELQYTYEGGIRVIHLSEVAITAERKPLKKSIYYDISPANSVTEDVIEKLATTDITTLLMQIPGVFATKDFLGNVSVTIQRGGMSIENPNQPPLLVLDGVPADIDLGSINVHDIAQIDVLKGPEAAIYGARGANGVISIFLKGGEFRKHDPPKYHIKTILLLGYQRPVEFYSPKYDTSEKRNARTPDLRTTIHWQPVVQTDSLGVASFEFYTADEPTSYTVIIEGLTDDGKIIRQEEKLWRKVEASLSNPDK